MVSYTVKREIDGTYTLVIDRDGKVTRLPGYKFESSARYDGYQATRHKHEFKGWGTTSEARRRN